MKKMYILLLLILTINAKRMRYEKEYQQAANDILKGQMEYRLDDKSRVDILTDEYAIEVDFANKWAEAVGQSLYYALKTDRKPGIVIIIENIKDEKNINKLSQVCEKYDIKLWVINSNLEIKERGIK